MAFPAIVGSPIATSGVTATATPVVNLPPGAAGNGLIMLIRVAIGGAISFPGWTSLVNASSDAADDQQAILYRDADGTEGATVTGASGLARFASIVWEISGITPFSTQPPELSALATGSGLAPNPLAVIPTGGAKDYLFGVLVGLEGEQTFSTYPANYTLGQQNANSLAVGAVTLNVRVAGAWRQLNAASDDPGAVAYTGTSDDWTAHAIAIHPAPVLVLKAGSDTNTLTLTETVLVFLTHPTSPESLALGLIESALAVEVVPPTVRTRLTAVGIPGRRKPAIVAPQVPSVASDSLALQGTEAANAFVLLGRADSAGLSSTEVSSTITIVSVSDSTMLSLIEVQSSVLSSAVTETLSLQGSESGSAHEPRAASESLGLSLLETGVASTLTERAVTRLSVIGIPGRRRVVAVSPVDVNDSLGLGLSIETVMIHSVSAVVDSAALASLEAVSSALSSGVLDTSIISLTDITESALNSAVLDLNFVAVSDQVTSALSSQVLDTVMPSISEILVMDVTIEVLESAGLSIPDVSSVATVGFIAAEAADSTSLGLMEAVISLLQSDRPETLGLFVADIASSVLSSVLAESVLLQVSDVAALASTSALSDQVALSLMESATIFATTVMSDTAAVSLTESGLLGFIHSEVGSLTILEVADAIATLLSLVDISDTASLGLTDSATTTRLVAAVDGVDVIVEEDAELLTSGEFTPSADETVALGIADTAGSILFSAGIDSLILGLGEVLTLASQSTRLDEVALSLLDVSALERRSPVGDTANLAVMETGGLLISIEASDALSLSIEEIADVETSGLIPVDVEDDTILSLTDTTQLLGVVVATDSLSTSSLDIIANLFSTLFRTEALLLQASESPAVFGQLSPAESASLSVLESATSALSSDRTETLGLSVTETIQVFPLLAVQDSMALSGGDVVSSLSSSSQVSESLALSLTEAASVDTTTAPLVLKTVAETLSFSLTDQGALRCAIDTSDTAGVGLTETAVITMGVEAHFTAGPASGAVPLAVQFTDTSIGVVTTWDWLFGDGESSTEQHPTHIYLTPGPYTVTLLVSGPTGLDGMIAPEAIVVTEAVVPVPPSPPVRPQGAEIELLMYTDEEIGLMMDVREAVSISVVTG